MQRKNEFDEFFIRDTGAEFAIDHVAGSFGQRLVIDGINGGMERFDVEETVFTRAA